MNDLRRSRWILLATSVFLSVAVAEIGLRFGSRASVFLDSRANEYWRVRLHESPMQSPKGDEVRYDAELGWRMNPWLRGNPLIDGFSISFTGENDEDIPKSKRLRILSVGDSYTYGLGVGADHTFTSLLDRGANTEAFNAGANSYGLDQSILLWEKRATGLEPDVVILGYLVDGFFRNMLHTRDKPKPYFEFDEQTKSFRLHHVPVPDVRKPAIRTRIANAPGWRLPAALAWVARTAMKHFGYSDRSRLERGQALSAFLLVRMRDSVDASGARLIVAILGTCQESDAEYLLVEAAILDTCRTHGIECLNTAEAMRAGDYASYFGENCHFGEKGHEFVAKELSAALSIAQSMDRELE